jgi:isopentenyl-diphosphate delta-isomerase
MTGGTEIAYKVNHNLARVCHEFGLGMGLGSCRQLLYSDEFFADFDVRETIGLQPLLANLGIAQVIEVIKKEEYLKVDQLISNLRADGLIIHINPLQEWLQPEGDKITMNPIKAIEKIVENCNFPILVKEVGQGFGPASLKALLEMDIAGIELAGFGGTNFAMLETLRSEESMHSHLTRVGHSAEEMVEFLNELSLSNISYLEKHIIISGGIKDYLTGYYLNELCNFPSVYGQASQFLKYALEDYAVLARYVEEQIKGYKIAKQFLKIRK